MSSENNKPTYVEDRFSRSNSSVLIEDFLNAPQDIYFSNEFSITAWINIKALQSNSTFRLILLDFGNDFGIASDDVILQIENDNLKGFVYKGTTESSSVSNDKTNDSLIEFNTWYHVAFVVEKLSGYLYLNGKQLTNAPVHTPNRVLRKKNVIGKSDKNMNLSISLDDLKIFQGALLQEEVKFDYKSGLFFFNLKKLSFLLFLKELKFVAQLIHFWPMSNLEDVVEESRNFATDYDRFNNPSAAIYLNNGYLTLPPGVYFPGDFSITFWLKFKTLQKHATIFDFGNGPGSDNILLEFISTVDLTTFSIRIYKKTDDYSTIQFDYKFEINEWYLLTFVLKEDTGTFYVNDKQAKSGHIYSPNDLNRAMNYVGKSSNPNDLNVNIVIQDFKIYKGSLLPSEVASEFNLTCKY